MFVSYTSLRGRRAAPRAETSWAMDSAAYTELSKHGRWTIPAEEYAPAVADLATRVGRMTWASPQDWLCTPDVVDATGLTVDEHTTRTVESLLECRTLAPEVPWAPILQGWDLADFEACAAKYESLGVDLTAEPIVGLGSIAGRQRTWEVERIVRTFHDRGVRLHGFGVKIRGLARYGQWLASADSMAWSYEARMAPHPLPGCSHRSCNNCARYALRWREKILRILDTPQGVLFDDLT